MHEFSLMADLLRKIEQMARDANAGSVVGVKSITGSNNRPNFLASMRRCAICRKLRRVFAFPELGGVIFRSPCRIIRLPSESV